MAAGLPGLDVSHFQGTVDWARVAGGGKVFSFIKATEGAHTSDARFEANRRGAKQNGIIVGAYHFFHPGRAVADQVKLFVDAVTALEPGELPPVLDLEVPDEWQAIAKGDRMNLVTAWIDQVEQALGVTPIIYAGPNVVDTILGNDAKLSTYRLWLASYRREPKVPDPWRDWTFWQFTENGSTDGISGNVDLDLFNGSLDELKTLQVQAPAVLTVAAERVAKVAKRTTRKPVARKRGARKRTVPAAGRSSRRGSRSKRGRRR